MKRTGIILFIVLIIITIAFWLTFLISAVDSQENRTVLIKIESGTSSREIGNILYSRGLIKSKFLFNALVSLQGLDSQLKAGLYELKTSYSLTDILDRLVSGKIATFQITIPEGYTVEEVIDRLIEKTIYGRESYEEEARKRFNKPYLKELNKFVKYPIEGFLYPSTYYIPREYKPDQIFMVMLNEFEKRWLDRLEQETREREYSLTEIMTIASLIEEEAKLKEEKPLIAAVIYNRLKQGMFLQVDASVQYSLPVRKERVLYSDLNVNSLYNTYRHMGLPPGPISNPGDASIEAALYPAEVDYLFYFALPDGSHVFSRTYTEHLQKQRELREDNE